MPPRVVIGTIIVVALIVADRKALIPAGAAHGGVPRGDSDTLAAITGSIAEAFYGVPEELQQECRKRLTPKLAEILRRWESALYNEKICGRI